jgi:hypothetical protein
VRDIHFISSAGDGKRKALSQRQQA